MDEKKALKRSGRLAILWILLAIIAAVSVTFAWFNFNSTTNIEPNTGSTIGDGDASLLISSTRNGNFDKTCDLYPQNAGGDLRPVSTSNLNGFYKAVAQDDKGISTLYTDASSDVDKSTLHGEVYLTCRQGNLDVYFLKQGTNFGNDMQALAAMRLGVKISSSSVSESYIFKLDSIADTSAAKSIQTVPSRNTVVSSVNNGVATYVNDPARNIGDYFANSTGLDDKDPGPGKSKLCTVRDGDIVKVEYWLYLEGCDDNCSNPVKSKDVNLQLSFAGVATN